MPSEQHEQVVALFKARPAAAASIEQWRAQYDALADFYPLAADIELRETPAGGVPADWVSAPGADAQRVILYLHGGGYVIGSRRSHRELCSRLSRAAGARVLLIDYRRAPEAPYPAAVQDAAASYRWLLEQGFAPSRVVLGGDSAGGGLTMATLITLRDAGDPLPAAAFVLSPWVDLQCARAAALAGQVDDPICKLPELQQWAAYYAPGRLADPLVSPLGADLRGLPPCLIQVGTREILRDDATGLADALRAAGVSVELEPGEGLIHVWQQLAAAAPEAAGAVQRIGRFVRAAT